MARPRTLIASWNSNDGNIAFVKSLYRQAISYAHRTRDIVRETSWRPRWARIEDNPPEPDPVEGSRLFAILGTYNESDVVEASVANAFAQGVERVYLVDNASTDDTVARALAAGATLADSFETECIQESVRVLLM